MTKPFVPDAYAYYNAFAKLAKTLTNTNVSEAERLEAAQERVYGRLLLGAAAGHITVTQNESGAITDVLVPATLRRKK